MKTFFARATPSVIERVASCQVQCGGAVGVRRSPSEPIGPTVATVGAKMPVILKPFALNGMKLPRCQVDKVFVFKT